MPTTWRWPSPILPDERCTAPKPLPVPDIAYLESESPVWIRSAWVVAATISQSVSRTGWPVAFSGTDHGTIAELPVVPVQVTGATTHVPAQYVWTDGQRSALARNGLMAIQARPNSTSVSVMSVPTLFEPEHFGNAAAAREAKLHATLPYRLFAKLDRLAPVFRPRSTVDSLVR